MLLFLLCLSLVRANGDFSVASYLPEWRYEGANWETISQYTSHLILFSLEVGPRGTIQALDRIPRPELLAQAREAATRHGTKLMICFGGNGRSQGFGPMVANKKERKTFVSNLVALCDEYGFDGVDYNWEYPGYTFGRGYKSEEGVRADYDGLLELLKETKRAFSEGSPERVITMAYYPDGRQEELLAERGAPQYVDLFHMMSYDQNGAQHSSFDFGKLAVQRGLKHLPAHKLTMGVPFYGRHSKTGDWVTYEDLVQQHQLVGEVKQALDSVKVEGGTMGFNGVKTISRKTLYAAQQSLGGVMIWEVGQDCRIHPVTHGATTHVTTCPEGEKSSLLVAIGNAMKEAEVSREGQTQTGTEKDEL